MICNKCGIELPDDATVCTQCGEIFEAAPAVEEAAAPAEVTETPAEAPKASFFEKVGGFMAKIPLLGKIKFLQTKTGILVSAIAIVCVIAILFSSVVGIIAINASPRSLAKKYAKASVDGDRKTIFSMQAGKMKQRFEDRYENPEDKARLFENMEESCEDEGIRANINTFNQYYRAYEKLTKAEMKEEFGFLYKVTVKVRGVEKMTDDRLETIRSSYSYDSYEDYINPKRIRKGKLVHITITVRGIDDIGDPETIDTTISMIKYKGKWKVL